jgi:hypothetical protein
MEKSPEAEPAVDSSPWNVASDTKPLLRLSNEIDDKAIENGGEEAQEKTEARSPFYDNSFSDSEEEENEFQNDPQEDSKPKGRKLLLSLLALAIVIALYYFIQSSDLFSRATKDPSAASTSTLSQGFRTLPPTWTPDVATATQAAPQATSTLSPESSLLEI